MWKLHCRPWMNHPVTCRPAPASVSGSVLAAARNTDCRGGLSLEGGGRSTALQPETEIPATVAVTLSSAPEAPVKAFTSSARPVDPEETILYILEEYYTSAQPKQGITPSLPASGSEPCIGQTGKSVTAISIPTQPDLYTCLEETLCGA